jgi:hypothetical protein
VTTLDQLDTFPPDKTAFAQTMYLIATALANYSRSLELRSRGLSGLHVFTWQCDQLF